jgi:hypothetical protein
VGFPPTPWVSTHALLFLFFAIHSTRANNAERPSLGVCIIFVKLKLIDVLSMGFEQVFRTMKKQGLDVESSQLETAEGLIKLAIIALCAAIQILQLALARDGETKQKTNDVFTKKEQVVLAILLTKLEGKTEKQKNPFPQENLGWATWIIARLGGWGGYMKSERPPGPITLGRGLKRFDGL